MNKIKVVQVGCGKMSKFTMRYVFEKGASIVGAVDINPQVIGQDIGTIMATKPYNIVIEDISNLGNLLDRVKPDICIVTTMSLLNDLEETLRIIVNHGSNAITTCEEAFYSKNSNPTVWKDLDILAKANRVTITGCGYQDVFWGNLISVIAGSTHQINKIVGSSSYNVEDYGIALAKAHGAGLSLEAFAKEIASADNISETERENLIQNKLFLPSYMWNTVGWLADKFHLTITSMKQECLPTTHDSDLHSTTLNMTIPSGYATGMRAKVTATTQENITLIAECVGKVYAPDEFDKNEWTIEGEPNTTVTVNHPATVELTCADIVNRLPDVINSEPGFIPTSAFNDPQYRLHDLTTYLK